MIKTYYLSNGNEKLSEHFSLSEFQCKNGTDEIKVSDILIEYLEKLRAKLNSDSVLINSGYRTSEYSVTVGGSENDPHTKGIAADIHAYRNGELISGAELCCAAQEIGFGGIGYMGSSIHVDVRNKEEYYNNHWWGNEQTGENVSDWFDYFGVEKPQSETETTDNINAGGYKVGDIVSYSRIWASANDDSDGSVPYYTEGEITQIFEGTKHPYLIGNGTGFIDDSVIDGGAVSDENEINGIEEKIAVVQAGEGFWNIAERCLGDGNRYLELAEYNGMTADTTLYVGMELKLPQ